MIVPGYRDRPPDEWDPDAPVDQNEAEDFLRLCYAENPRLGRVEARLASVRAQIAATGTYAHTAEELAHGARMAWRNASRCIGRLYWRSLVVLDRRRSRTPQEIFDRLVDHLTTAGGGRRPGRIRPVISIFAAAVPGRPHARVWNEQLIRYAGYATKGDPAQRELTDRVTALGWRGKGEAFDVLPLAVEVPGEPVRLFDLPEHAILEVPLSHPDYPWFAELGLRWHAIPAVSSMRLTIGGVSYPLAPFSGWYMGTEIGSRNLGDRDRYDLLPAVAQRIGLDTSCEATLWRDRALVELNRAVLWSFDRAGITVADHHTESDRFVSHLRREGRSGRPVPADWAWIVPPLSGSATSVFHRWYTELDLRPNFYPGPTRSR